LLCQEKLGFLTLVPLAATVTAIEITTRIRGRAVQAGNSGTEGEGTAEAEGVGLGLGVGIGVEAGVVDGVALEVNKGDGVGVAGGYNVNAYVKVVDAS
jgi:hypothetical protein